MGYTLRAGITTGSLDAGDLGDFAIEDRQVTVDDYDTARQLVQRYPLEWPDGDPGGPDDAAGGDSPRRKSEANASDDAAESPDTDAATQADLLPGDSVDVGEAPFDPGESTVSELREELSDADYSDSELAALHSAEAAGENRTTAKELIDSKLGG